MNIRIFIRGFLVLATLGVAAAGTLAAIMAPSPALIGVLTGGLLAVADIIFLVIASRALLGQQMRRPILVALVLPLKFVALTALIFLFVVVCSLPPGWFAAGVTTAVVALVVETYRYRRVQGA